MKQDKFNFFIPVEFEKAQDEKKELVRIKGVCSTDAEDSDGEVLIPSGFDFKPLLETGFLNWNHQAKTTSSAICGEPTKAEVIDNGKSFYIEGFLYPNKEGKRIAELAQTLDSFSTRRLGFSIEGQALERDVLNPKKVLRARITGVAITQSPKNPKTLLDIVKGEYNEDDLEESEEDEKDEVDKAMSVNVDINPESVEGQNNKNEVDSFLKKSYIYNKIHSKYTRDFEKADQIYNFIKKINQKEMSIEAENITSEVLEKALNILDESIELIKSEEQKTLDDYDKKDELEENFDKGDDKENSSNEEEQVEENQDDDNEDDDEEFEKAMNAEEIAKSLFEKGMKKGEVIKAMTSVGIDLNLAKMSCSNCIIQLSEQDIQGGKIITLSKGSEDELGGRVRTSIETTLESVSRILKSNTDTIINLTRSQKEMQERILKMEKAPFARKSSISTRGVIERFEKSSDGRGSENSFNSRDPKDMQRLGERLYDEVVILKSRGEHDMDLEKAVSDLEIAKFTNFERIQGRLRSMGISVY